MQPDYARSYRMLWERHWWWRSREAFVLGWIRRLHRRSSEGLPRSALPRPPQAVLPRDRGGEKPSRWRILDVGCGDGLFFEALARFGEVEGLEPDASLVSDPRWRSRIRVEALGDAFAGSGDYDLVLMLDVLEHIAGEAEALRAAWRALRPGGYLLVTVPALRWLWSRHDEANAHHRRYQPAALRSALEGAGLEVKTLRFFFCWTVAPMLARRWLSPAGAGAADYAVSVPAPMVNRALTLLSVAEHALGRVVRWPFGSSLLAIARRPAVASASGRRGRRFSKGTRLLLPTIPGE